MTIAIATPHRPDIQALRAVAIMLVIAGHAQIFGLSGGFVGVDVFFVLSGYLITGLITTETLQRRQFDALGFYLRRLKRLYPALIVVIAISAAAAWLFMSPLRQTDDALAGQSAVLWLSNFYFAAHGMNYFSPARGAQFISAHLVTGCRRTVLSRLAMDSLVCPWHLALAGCAV